MANCKYCGKEITWMRDGKKTSPIENDGVVHECEEYKNTRSSIRTITADELPADLLAQYEQGINAENKKTAKKDKK